METRIQSSESLEVVIKVAEKCNINCSYCYVFNKGNERYKGKPARMSREVMHETVRFIKEGIAELNILKTVIVFHGGEPLMLGKRDFEYFCALIRRELDSITHLELSMQTNAMLIDPQWIDLLVKYGVRAGVSIDGIREVHDAERVDFKGRGTYDKTIKGLTLLREANEKGLLPSAGAICVVQPQSNGKITYRHFVDDLKVKGMTFHLPMDTHDSFAGQDPMPYAHFVCDAFDEWIKDNDPTIDVRMFSQLLAFLQGRIQITEGNPSHINLQHITVESDGAIDIDELKPAPLQYDVMNVKTNSLAEFANSSLSRFVRDVYSSLSEQCMPCVWRNYCRGGLQHGLQVNRWSNERGFDNASVLCSALKKIYSHISSHMLAAGFSEESIVDSLDHSRRSYIPAKLLNIGPELAGCKI